MKNIFKVMGIALLACSMIMVSCKKDDDSNNGGSSTLTIKWDNATQSLGYELEESYADAQGVAKLFYLEAAKGVNADDDYIFPAFETYFYNGQAGLYPASLYRFITEDGDTVSGNYYYPTQVYDEGAIEIQGYTYGDYQLRGVTEEPTISDFDATTPSFSAIVNFRMYQYEDMQGAQSWDDIDQKDFNLSFTKLAFPIATNEE